jgi:poly-gamma-glutamate capsule biosynthesis protein CapA/YwtB (metallophosphatase superfamily)
MYSVNGLGTVRGQLPPQRHFSLLAGRPPGSLEAVRTSDARSSVYAGEMMARAGWAALLVVLLTGCQASGDNPQPSPISGVSSSVSSSDSPNATTRPATPAPPGYSVPLALVVNATRPTADVKVADARRVVRSGGTRWSAVGQSGGRMRVQSTEERAASEVLREVQASRDVLGIVPADAVDARVRVLTVGGRHPLREPERYPLHTHSARPVPEVTTITAVGDIMLGRRVGDRHRSDPGAPLKPLAKRLAAAEITVGNFESTLSAAGAPRQGNDSFAASPGVIPGLRTAGFDLMSLANNHVGDYGDRALRQTLSRFASAGIKTVGAGQNLAAARRPVIVEREGVRVGFLAIDSIGETPAATRIRSGTNRLNMPPRTGPLNRSQLQRISTDVRALSKRVDVAVVITHWGTQYTHRPEPSQRQAARALANAGADLVIGGHPHWVQGFEMAGSTVVVHSLGNFVFDMDFQTKTREGIFLEIVLWGGAVKAVEPVPYQIDGAFTPRLIRGERAQNILADVWRSSRGPFAQ